MKRPVRIWKCPRAARRGLAGVIVGATLVVLAGAAAPATGPATSPAGGDAAAAPLPPELEKRIHELVRKLSADNWKDRDAAENALEALGPEAEPLLRRLADEAAAPEAGARLKNVLRTLAGRRWAGPSFVTLRLKGAPPRRAFEEIFRQAGAEFITYPPDLLDPPLPGAPQGNPGLPAVTVEFNRAPFWVVLKEVCNQTGVNARNVYDRHRISLSREPGNAPMAGPSTVQGPVLVSAEGVNLAAGVQFVNPAGTRRRGGSLTLQVYTEPRFRVTRGHFVPETLEDDKGGDLLMRGADEAKRVVPEANALQQNTASFAWQVAVPMRLPTPDATTARLRGKLHLTAHAETRRVEIDDVLNAKEQTREVAGKRFTVHSVTPTGDGTYNVPMTIFRENVVEEDWKWFRYPYGQVRLLDARGRDLATASGGGGGGDNGKADFAVQFRREAVGSAPEQQPGEPFKFVWDLPVKTRELIVPVEFENLPLP